MKSSKLLPIFAFVFFFSLLFFQSVFADFDTERFITVKAVITFEHSATEAQVLNNYVNVVKPQAVTIINAYSTNIANFTMQARPDNQVLDTIGFNSTSGKNVYQLYAKVTFFGDLPNGVTIQQFRNGFDNFMGDIRDLFRSELVGNGATEIRHHIHFTTGEVDG